MKSGSERVPTSFREDAISTTIRQLPVVEDFAAGRQEAGWAPGADESRGRIACRSRSQPLDGLRGRRLARLASSASRREEWQALKFPGPKYWAPAQAFGSVCPASARKPELQASLPSDLPISGRG